MTEERPDGVTAFEWYGHDIPGDLQDDYDAFIRQWQPNGPGSAPEPVWRVLKAFFALAWRNSRPNITKAYAEKAIVWVLAVPDAPGQLERAQAMVTVMMLAHEGATDGSSTWPVLRAAIHMMKGGT